MLSPFGFVACGATRTAGSADFLSSNKVFKGSPLTASTSLCRNPSAVATTFASCALPSIFGSDQFSGKHPSEKRSTKQDEGIGREQKRRLEVQAAKLVKRVCVSLSCMAVVVSPWTLAPLQCRDGASRVFTDQVDFGRFYTKREAKREVFRRVAASVSCILPRTAREAGFGTLCVLPRTYGMTASKRKDYFPGVATFRDSHRYSIFSLFDLASYLLKNLSILTPASF